MKAQTQVEDAVRAYYAAYCEYARQIDGVPVKTPFPKVAWVPGSLKNSASGWTIDGHTHNGTALEVVQMWNKLTERMIVKLQRKLEAQTLKQEPLPEPESNG